MTTNQIQAAARYVGLEVHSYSPGDGVTRYRFFPLSNDRQDYFGPGNGLGTVLGRAAAETWLNGFTAARTTDAVR